MQHIGDERARYWLKVRLGLVAFVFVCGFLAVIGRVYYLQTVEAEALQERTAVQRDNLVERQARRGDIVDRNGVEMAVSVEVPSIYARPQLMGDIDGAVPALAEALEVSPEWLHRRLDTDQPFVWLRRQAHPETAQAVEDLGLSGVKMTTEYKRYYPMGEVAGQLLGFVGIDGDGLEGLERQYDSQLAGETYEMSISRDALGRPMLLSETPEFGKFEGHSLRLTVDEKIQRTAEEALAEQVEKYDAKGGYALVMDVENGDLLAMARVPFFNPNRIGDHESADWRLGPVTDLFEPGSVFKPFLLAAALQEQTTTLDRVYDLHGGQMRIGKYWIRDITRRDEMTSAEIIQKSSNVGSYEIARELGRDTYYDYLRAFGFGTPTGVGLRGERSGVVWPPDQWAEITFANVAFGQGISVTALQLVTAVAALANGGKLLEPRIVDEVRNRNGEVVHRDDPTMVRQVISPEVAEQMAWAMSLVTVPGGTGTAAALEHFTVAGKTGTAQQVDPETRTYSSEMWISGFVGFAPAEAPEVAIAVFVDQPQGMRYGGRVAGPAFQEIAAEALARRGTTPIPTDQRFQLGDDPPEIKPSSLPTPVGEETVILPARRILSQGSVELEEVSEVPDFTHLTLRQAIDQAHRVGLIPRVSGSGRVIAQYPESGTPIENAVEVQLSLTRQLDAQWVTGEPTLVEVAGEE